MNGQRVMHLNPRHAMMRHTKKIVALSAALIIGLSGCGSSGTGESAADKAAAARASQAAAAKAHQSEVYRECKTFMGPLDTKLSNLDALLDTGVQFSEYTSRVGQVSIAYNKLVKAMKANGGIDQHCLNKVGIPLEAAYNAYTRGGNTWNDCLQDYDCSFDKGSTALTSTQKQWAKADRSISKAEAALNKLAPK